MGCSRSIDRCRFRLTESGLPGAGAGYGQAALHKRRCTCPVLALQLKARPTCGTALFLEILLVAALIVLNGALAMSELAIVSSRPARLKPLAEAGDKGALAALKLALDPGRFLSSVQIGITLVGELSGAISGATLGGRLGQGLIVIGVAPDWAHSLGVVGVVVVITYFSLVVGELVPKQIALQNPERAARRAAPIMVAFARIAAPRSGFWTFQAGSCWPCWGSAAKTPQG